MPTPLPTDQTLFVASGSTGLALLGASVISAGVTLQSDAQGKVTLPASAAVGTPVNIQASTYLERQTTLKSAGERIFLWPRVLGPDANESFTARLGYTATAAGSVEGAAPLRRLPPGTQTVFVYLPPEIRTDVFVQSLQTAVGRINEATQNVPSYQVALARPGSEAITFELSIDGTDSSCSSLVAFFRPTLVSGSNGNELLGGLINLCDVRYSRDSLVITHELGHTLGLYHSTRTVDMMNARLAGQTGFTGEEKLLIALAKLRRGGNRFPDDDRSSQSASSSAVNEVILCGR